MEENLQITKIKINDDATGTITYNLNNDTDEQEIVYKGREKVTEKFAKSFIETNNTFVEYFSRLKSDVNKILVQEISFEYKGKSLENVTYTVNYYPQPTLKTKVVIKTPKLPIFKESLKDAVFSICGEDVELLERLQFLAQAYINGDTRTKQGTLDLKIDGKVVEE